jgi:tRNA (guanine-N7-)-methyltransferase
MAERHPEVSFIAVEMDSSVLAGAVKAAEAAGSPANLRFALGFAEKTDEYFGRGEVTRIYINFCDPWRNRARWFKRRLTHRGFLDKYRRVLKPGGDVWVKTDNRDLFKFSLREFAEAGWVIKDVSEDLANSGFEENVVTEYERRFMENGLPIYRIAAYAGDGCPV